MKRMELNALIKTVTEYAGTAAEGPLTAAYSIAENAHEGYRRLSGEPYINHSLAVAAILADWHATPDVIAVGLLHDVLTPNYSHIHRRETIEHELLPEWLLLLDSITKLNSFIRRFEGDFNRDAGTSIEGELSREVNANILLHDALSIIHDHNAFIIKIADRLHNLQTVASLDREHQQRTANVILNIFAPLADRFGMGKVKRSLEDQSFNIILPAYYSYLADLLASSKLNLEADSIASEIRQKLMSEHLECEIYWQPLSLYAMYQRQLQVNARHGQLPRDVPLSIQLEDTGSFVFLTDKDIQGCYQLIGELHRRYKAVDSQWHDYISTPQTNGYHAIHTQVIYANGHHINCVVRTHVMDVVADYGYTAHWRGWHIPEEYLPKLPAADRPAPGEIIVYTPQGDEKYLPHGVTPLDFAYEVHTDLGDHCTGARVNGKLVNMYSTLHNKDVVEILVSENASPNPEWLNHVATVHAMNRIRHALTILHHDEMEKRGRTLLDQALQPYHRTSSDREIISILTHIALKENLEEPDDVLVSLGAGRWPVKKLTSYIQGIRSTRYVAPATPVKILALEYATLRYDFAHCCKPELSDAIVGHLRKNQTLLVHTGSCSRIHHIKKLVEVEWDSTPPEPDYMVVIEALAKPALLAGIGRVLESLQIEAEITEHRRQDGILTDTELYLGHTTKLQRDFLLKEFKAISIIKNVGVIHISERKSLPRQNPYTLHPATGKQFYGRDDEYQRFVSLLSENHNSTILLWGLHGIGKTSLLRHIEETEQDTFLPVYIDLLGCDGCTMTQFLYNLIQKIHSQLKAFDREAAHGIAVSRLNHFESDPIGGLERFLAKVHEHLNYRSLVVILDELQSLHALSDDKVSRTTLFNHLHSLSQQGTGLHFVLCGNGMPDNFLEQSGLTSLRASSQEMNLSYLREKDASRLITEGLTSIAVVEDEAVRFLLRVTASHPYYLQLLCYELFNELQKEQCEMTLPYTHSMLNRWIKESGNRAFLRVLDDVNADNMQKNKLVLSAIAKLGDENPLVSLDSLSKALGSSMLERDLLHSLDDLTTMAVLKHDYPNYSIEVELLARWLRQHWPLEKMLKGAYV